jgi:DNA-binding transcriptional LysR family regulator
MKTDLELRHLRAFVAVVEAGTHTRAARALGMSQSTVSETLSALERSVGVELLRKVGKGLAPTPAGEIVLSHARRMFALTHDLTVALAETASTVNATLLVSAVESIGAYVLPSRLAELRERWPTVRVEVLTGTCAEIRERVVAGASDVGLVLEPEHGAEPGEVLARARLLVVCAPNDPLAGAAAVGELLGRDFHMCDAGGNYHQALRQLFAAGGLPAPRMQAMGTIEGVKRGVAAGTGALGLLPEHAVEAELRDGRLAELRVGPGLPCVVLKAVRPAGSGRSPVVEDLVGSLRRVPAKGLRLVAGPSGGGGETRGARRRA